MAQAGSLEMQKRTSSETTCGRSVPGFAEEIDEVAGHDALDIDGRVAATVEDVGQFLQVGDRLQIVGGLFLTEAAVEVGADAAMVRIPRKLADVVGVVGEVFHRNGRRIGDADLPARTLSVHANRLDSGSADDRQSP